MRPDLFAGPAQQDDNHRILARLENGGIAPVPARQLNFLNAPQRARMAAVIAVLAAIAAAWAWLQDAGTTPQPPTPQQAGELAMREHVAALRPAADYAQGAQAATIINEPVRPAAAAPQPQAQAATGSEPHVAHQRATKPAATARSQRSAVSAPVERDEDVTLLTAMLKHANGQKGASTPPND